MALYFLPQCKMHRMEGRFPIIVASPSSSWITLPTLLVTPTGPVREFVARACLKAYSRHPSSMKFFHRSIGLARWLAVFCCVTLHAENWAQWRGPAFNGSSPETDLPTQFSKTENVKWAANLPGPASATPVVWRDHVFVSSTDSKAQTLVAMALDRNSGELLWQHKISDGVGRDRMSSYAAPSPVTDGERVIFYYGNGALAAFDFSGKALWSRNIETDEGSFATQWTYAASPLLLDGKLYIQVLQRDVPVNGRGRKGGPIGSYILAINSASGKTLWKHIRPSKAKAASREAFTTPIPLTFYVGPRNDSALYDDINRPWYRPPDLGQPVLRYQLLIAGGDCITGHDPATGEELWRWGTYNPTRIGHWRLVPSPVVAGASVIVCAPKGDPVYAIKLLGTGVLDDSAISWQSEERDISTDVCTPLFYQGKLFVLNGERKTLSRLDPATGKADWTGKLGTRVKFEGSPTAADGKIYFLNHEAEMFVVSAGDKFEILHTVAMGGDADRNTRSSIAISDGNLFIRTATKLYCIGE